MNFADLNELFSKSKIRVPISQKDIDALQAFGRAVDRIGVKLPPKWTPKHPEQSINAMLAAAADHNTNKQRLTRWKIRYSMHTGNRPVDNYVVLFCRTCNKPHWYLDPRNKYLTARCHGH